jgi:hypothetical protein
MSETSSSTPYTGVRNFKDAVHEWMGVHDFISQSQAEIRQKRKRLTQLEYFITTYLRDNDKDYCNIGDKEALCVKTKKTTGSLKKEHVTSFLNRMLQNEAQAIEYTKQLYDMREIKEKATIKRIHLE